MLREDNSEQIVVPSGHPDNELFDAPVQRVTEIFTMPPTSSAGRRPVNLHQDAMKKVIGQVSF